MNSTVALCYHALSLTWAADLCVRPDAFRTQLRALKQRGYRGVTFSEAVLVPSNEKRVAITFDDAFESVETLAKPVLDELGWPATLYVVTDYAETGQPLAWTGVGHWADTEHAGELASLDWPRLRALHDAGWEIGSHTVSHPFLTQITDEQLAHELEASRLIVEDRMGEPCASIAYPYGDCDQRVVAAAGAAGYQTGAGLPRNWPALTPLDYPRAGIWWSDDLRRFRMKASPLVQRLRRRAGR